jgi:predicted transcriptional regulator
MLMYRKTWETLVLMDAVGEPCTVQDVAAMRGVLSSTVHRSMLRLVDAGVLRVETVGLHNIGHYTLTAKARRMLNEAGGGLWGDFRPQPRGERGAPRAACRVAVATLDKAGPFTERDVVDAAGVPRNSVKVLFGNLTRAGAIKQVGTRHAGGPGRPATLYRLTSKGRRTLAATVEQDAA